MKREIKFRAWDADAEYMVYSDNENDYGDFSFEFGFGKSLGCYAFPPIEERGNENSSSRKLDNLMQFIGLKDRKNLDIYEGDIVQKWLYDKIEWTATVKHVDYIDSLMDDYRGRNVSGFYLCNDDWDYPNESFDNVEIIGNIWENPTLL